MGFRRPSILMMLTMMMMMIISLALQEIAVSHELPKFRNLTLKMTSDAVENDTVKLAILKNLYIDPQIVSLALLEVTETQNRQKLSKFGNVTLNYDLSTL